MKNKSNIVFIIIIIVLLIICIGMGTVLFINKDKIFTKEVANEEKNSNIDRLPLYYETKTSGEREKYPGRKQYVLALIKNGSEFILEELQPDAVMHVGEAYITIAMGTYSIKDNELTLKIDNVNHTTGEEKSSYYDSAWVFSSLKVNLTYENKTKEEYEVEIPDYYFNTYKTTFNEEELTIGNKTFYRVK